MARIVRLDENVVNKIAAGEVIHRPSSALKEMLENSIDAGSKKISVVLMEGGLKLMKIQDDGSGIRKEDFPLVCERFATSKIKNYEDLEKVTTFGFRGEALASITHVAKVNVMSMTRDDQYAHSASFFEGVMQEEPKACASVPGTTITVEDMFFNNEIRRKAMKNYSEEYSKCLDIIIRYSIHFPSVSFNCKKMNSNVADLCTYPNSSVLENIKISFGQNLSRELLAIEKDLPEYATKFSGYVSHTSYSLKKLVFILFINSRLVDCSSIRKAVEMIYTRHLPKQSHPFVYLSIEMEPSNVDVNVHPTKREVIFLHEDAIVGLIQAHLESALESNSKSRVFYNHIQLPISNFTNSKPLSQEVASEPALKKLKPSSDFVSKVTADSAISKTTANKMVRTDAFQSTLESSLVQSRNLPNRPPCDLASVQSMIDQIEEKSSPELCAMFKDHIIVGALNDVYSIVQCKTRLYVINTSILSYSLFYQLSVRNFSVFKRIQFKNPISVTTLINSCVCELPDSQQIQLEIREKLLSNKNMISEYFSIDIDENYCVSSLPIICPGYIPNLDYLPVFLSRLALKVDYRTERECFENICHELASFYQCRPSERENVAMKETVVNILLPVMRYNFSPPKTHDHDGSVIQVACLEHLYKIFERC